MFFPTVPLILLALVSVYSDWLSFPLTAPLNAYEITWAWHKQFPLVLGAAFQTMIAVGAVSMLLRRFLVSLIILSGALALLLFLPWYAAFLHPDWLVDFVLQSQQRLELESFTREYFVLNVNSEPTFAPVEEFESLLDQAGIAVGMVSAGWYMALSANLALLVVLVHHWSLSVFKSLITGALIVSFWLSPVCYSGIVLARAGQAQYQGNRQLLLDRPNEALQSYQEAMQFNPALTYSTPFLLMVAHAYANLTNEHHPASKIVEAWMIIQQKGLFSENVASSKSYRIVRTLLEEAGGNDFSSTSMEKALDEFGRRLIDRLWIYEGLAKYNQGDLQAAIYALQQGVVIGSQLTRRLILASLYIKLNDPQEALTLLEPYVGRIAHPSVKADFYCTIGDAYVRAKKPLKAREAYIDCVKWDNLKNYRVINALTGF